MDEKEFTKTAKLIIGTYMVSDLTVSKEEFEETDIYTVWLTKVLQNNKGLFSTTRSDGRYYEVTYNGDKDEYYFDSYVKEYNKAIPVVTPEED